MIRGGDDDDTRTIFIVLSKPYARVQSGHLSQSRRWYSLVVQNSL